ncbi:MAG: pitrilysin family protein [bacterium]|nr:pitrilysin family protein [bacterium]
MTRDNRWRTLLIPVLAAAAIIAAPPARSEPNVREERLPNGLTVLLRRVEGMPLVSVWSWIHAGSANEEPGCSGAAHWCEHMNFKGTRRWGRDEMKGVIESRGGAWNGYTWLDQTAYYQTLPAESLPLALNIEAERLARSLFRPEDVESERTVILSELRMGENDPENLLDIETTAAAFKAHPYRRPVIGWQSDVEAMGRDDLYRFYRRFYVPNNATLVVVGDIEEEAALRLINREFGPIPRGADVGRIRTVEPPQDGERRVTVERPGGAAYLQVLYRAPAADSDDFIPLLAVNTLLGGPESMNLSEVEWRGQGGRSSRLHRGLVDGGLAAKAGSLLLPTKYPAVFCVYATAAPGVSLDDLERETLRIVEGVGEGGVPADEFAKITHQMRARLVYDRESVTGSAQAFGFFDTVGARGLPDEIPPRLARLTPAEVAAAARRYLTPSGRTVGRFVPLEPAAGEVGTAGEGGAVRLARYGDHPRGGRPGLLDRIRSLFRGETEKPSEARPAEPPRPPARREAVPARARRDGGAISALWDRVSVRLPVRASLDAVRAELPNGLTLIVRENRAAPSVVARVDIAAGSSCDPSGLPGIAHFTARMLDRGSTAMSARLIADVLDSSGTELDISCGRDRAAVTARMLREKLPLVMEVLAQMVTSPVFPEEEIGKVGGRIATEIGEALRDTQRVAVDRLYELIYPPGHPYRHRVEGTAAAVRAIRRGELVEFHRSHYGPRATTIVLSGDVSAAEAAEVAARYFGRWRAERPLSAPTVLTPPLPPGTRRAAVEVPGKTQVDIAIGCRGIARDNPDYHALEVMNTILGRFGMGGRLGRAIREERGLAYYVSSAFVPYRHVGPFVVRAGVAPGDVDAAVGEILVQVKRMMEEGPTDEEMNESKAYLVLSVPRKLETNGAVAAALADLDYFNLGLDYYERYTDLVGRVGAEDVRRAAAAYLHPDRACVVLAGPVD